MMVFVFEDDHHLRGSIARALAAEGYSVFQAATVADGVWRICNDDVVVANGLLDATGRSLPDLLLDMRRIVPVVQITGDVDAKQHMLATAMLRKPFELSALLGAVAEAVEWSRRTLSSLAGVAESRR